MEHTPVCSKGHHPDPHHRDSDIWQGIVCRWSAGREKYRVPDVFREEATDVPFIDAKNRPEALGTDVVGVGKATSGSLTDKLTREHRLTLDEAHMILNTKKEDPLEQILSVSAKFSSIIFAFADGGCTSQHYEHLFKQNSPPEATTPAKPVVVKRAQVKCYSHYLQSKVVRARERIEAEHKVQNTSSESAPPPTPESAPPNQ
jgi:import inner membrane translocase subunit TIM16